MKSYEYEDIKRDLSEILKEPNTEILLYDLLAYVVEMKYDITMGVLEEVKKSFSLIGKP